MSLLSLVDPKTPSGKDFLTKALDDRSPRVVAKAGRLVRDSLLSEHLETVERQFLKWTNLKASIDPGCVAKTSLIKTLVELEEPATSAFTAGISLVQMEASYGPSIDTAAEIRGLSCIGLVRSRDKEVFGRIADLLADPEPMTRCLAARAASETGLADAAALLRLRLLSGEDNAEVMLECLSAILSLSPDSGIKFVRIRYFEDFSTEKWSVAALALGASRLPKALSLLQAEFPKISSATQRYSLLEAIAMTRLEQAKLFLLELAASRDTPGSEAASSVLETFWPDLA